MNKPTRCVNLDWLEVYAHEPLTERRDPDYFRSQGFVVREREYGTRVYEQMFTLEDRDGHPFIEVRRKPKSEVIDMNSCHIRLHNRTCYYNDAANIMKEFLSRYGITFVRISRVDICLDFEYFDSGDDPQKFLVRYLNGVYSKINQANISAHGTDRWDGRDWNSLSWGSPTSDIGTKMYNKTLELFDPITQSYKKPYIRQAWQACGLIHDWQYCTKVKPDGTVYKPAIWRVEFSIRSSVKGWFVINPDGKERKLHSIRNTLDMYDERSKLLVMFFSLARHYFHFKHYQEGQRKDRCRDKVLFIPGDIEYFYKIDKAQVASDHSADRRYNSLLVALQRYRETCTDQEVRKSCTKLIDYISKSISAMEMGANVSPQELSIWHYAAELVFAGDDRAFPTILNEVRTKLKLHRDVGYF